MASAVHGPRLVLLGRQGAGKGTQAAKLVVHLGVQHLSTGAILRQEVAAGTELGLHVQELMEAGDLVPDEIVLEVVAHQLADPDVQRRGFLLDGFPRTEPQASGLVDLLGRAGLDVAINLEVPAAVVRRRLMARRVCTRCETPTVARNREHTVYCQVCGGTAVRRPDDLRLVGCQAPLDGLGQVGPLLGFFRERNLLLEIDSVGTPDDVFDALLRSLRPVLWGEGEAVG